MKRVILFFIVAAFGCGFWAGCTVDTSAIDVEGVWPCKINTDCTSGFICENDFCERESGSVECIDVDNDGYGVGEERSTCKRCESFGQCEEDCNDNDPTIHPGAGEPCNGVDDNCNMEVDEPTLCDENKDCSSLDPNGQYIVECNTTRGECEIKMQTQICNPPNLPGCLCNDNPLLCANGSLPATPEPSECGF